MKYILKAEDLTIKYDLKDFTFESTEELEGLDGIIGQKRATDALNYGLKMKGQGYNIYVSGMSGTGKSTFTNSFTEKFAEKQPVPSDWIYVYNFNNKDSPRAISLKPGQGKQFKEKIDEILKNLKKLIPETLRGVEYKSKKGNLLRLANQKKAKLLKDLNEKAAEYGFIYIPDDRGIMSSPLKDGRPLNEEEFYNLSIDEREKMMQGYEKLHLATLKDFNKIREVEDEFIKMVEDLDRTVVENLIQFDMEKLGEKYNGNSELIQHLGDFKKDILKNLDKFKENPGKNTDVFGISLGKDESFFKRYEVNLFVDNSDLKHAPVINESHPIYNNIMGSIEYKSQMGVLTTDFTYLKPGSLHLANGGYLIFQMEEILRNPISWEMLNRALKTEKINIEDQNKLMGLAIAASIKPEPIPLDIKILIIGDEKFYNLLYHGDSDFRKLFKIKADFDGEMENNRTNRDLLAKFIGTHCEENDLRHFDPLAVVRLVEYASRLAGDQDKLSTKFNGVSQLIYEADFWADEADSDIVRKLDVEKAIDEKIYRSNKYEEKQRDMFQDGTILMDLEGEKIGQINGLSVIGIGDYSFGRPNRITASVYRGRKGIIDINRESKQSGNIHHKGVLILSGYIGEKYASLKPLKISASIVFEQSYSLVDGDSASSAELYALLSALGKVPINQSIAVTGSVNQKGEIQPIGGVNEKIEGFYRICKEKGLNGKQGVMIPKKNIKNLILDREVIEAVEKGDFHIYAIEHIDEGIEILTGLKSEEVDQKIEENLESMKVKGKTNE